MELLSSIQQIDNWYKKLLETEPFYHILRESIGVAWTAVPEIIFYARFRLLKPPGSLFLSLRDVKSLP
jgi:hypothetical protein